MAEKTIEEYVSEYSSYMLSDLEHIKKSYIENKMFLTKRENIIKPIKNKSSYKTVLDDSWDNISNLIFGIRNNEYIINTLNTYKRQKIGIGYIYLESSEYLTIIIKKPNIYPLVVMRLPIEEPYIRINKDYIGLIFKFPIEYLISKESCEKIKNKQYRLYLIKDDTSHSLVLETINNNEIKKRNINNIQESDSQTLNLILKSTMISLIGKFELNPTKDISYSINNMNVVVLKKLKQNQSPIQLNPPGNKQNAYIVFDNDTMKFIIESEDVREETEILNRDNSNIWPTIDYNGKRYLIHDYEQMFKINHYAQQSARDGIYYLFSTFLNTKVFIKLITDQQVNLQNGINQLYTYQDIFNKKTQIIELYLLVEMDTK